jgi:hypothetical protein
MTPTRWFRTALLGGALLLSACGASQRPPASAARLKDSAPEKVAALRSATPGLEAEDARWGIGAAQERKRAADDERDRKRKSASAVDVRATPAVELTPAPPQLRGQHDE